MSNHPGLNRFSLIRLATYICLLAALAACSDGDTHVATVPTTDKMPPQVMITMPANGARGVALNSMLSATFSEAIDPSTLTSSTFTVNGVRGSITVSNNNRIARFTPVTPLRSGTHYTATLTTGARDIAGNALTRNFSWRFTTRAAAKIKAPTRVRVKARAAPPVQQASITPPIMYLADNPAIAYSLPFGAAGIESDEAITSDAAGNVYAAGYTGLKFFAGNGLNGQASTGSADLFITKYDASGSKQWAHQLGTAGGHSAQAITSDAAGNVYAAGSTGGALDGQSSAGGTDLFITKYAASGEKLWTRQLGTAGSDTAQAITSDAAGNIYAAGYTNGALDGQSSAGGYDLFITKYDANGVKLWTRQLGTAGSDYARAITSDAAGNVYAAGYTNGALDGQTNAGGYDLLIAKYDAHGVKLWMRQLGSTGIDAARAITCDAAGNVYAAGYTNGALDGQSSEGGADLFIIKYDPSGVKLWTRQLGSAGYDAAQAITSDATGNIYAAGYTNGTLDGQSSAGDADLFIIKYDPSGFRLWTRQLGSAGYDTARAITSDAAGNVVAAGYSNAAPDGQTRANDSGLFIVKYQADGRRR